ncbi:MAG: PKD domain-containing protein [Planctomycetes bacterium]|nr:PKD domain-containing protein [Planctomycetota bacterium]
MDNVTQRCMVIGVMIVTALNFSARRTRAQEQVLLRTVEEIRREATRSRQSDAGRPLPLAAHWNVSGASNEGFTPEYQLQLIRQGHHLLPWLGWPPTDRSIDVNFKPDDPRRQQYIDSQIKAYEPVVKELARLRLPISFLATQWESELTYDKAFLELPPEKNPNVVGLDGKVQRRVCPFGPVEPWREAGRRWTDNAFFRRIQAWYPDPPLVLLISNNEHGKLTWSEVEQSRRYLDKYGRGQPDDSKRKVVGDGWIERYGKMLESMRDGLVSPHWKKNARFIGYGAIAVDVPQSGSFYHVPEEGRQVRTVSKGGPPSFRVEAPRFLAVGAEGTCEVTEKYSPSGTIGPAQWEFGDGARGTGDRVSHRYAKAGQYLVNVTGSEGGTEVVRQQVPVFVGLKPEEGLVCRLLMKGALSKGMKSWLWLGRWEKREYHFIPDASGANNIGFLVGGAWVRDPQRGTVLELDGQHDRVEFGASPDINTGAAYRNRTVALWFRAAGADKLQSPPPTGKPQTQPQVLYEEGGPGAGFNLYLDGEVLYAGAWNGGQGVWLPSKSIDPDRWHHVVVVLHAAKADDLEPTVEFFLDGRNIAAGRAPVLGAHPNDINLGRCGNTLFHDGRAVGQPGHYFAGRLDDFQIINRSLTPEEIRALANGG